MKIKLLLLFLLSFTGLNAQNEAKILTVDIDNFWDAYDRLPECKTQEDSINTFQVYYIDKASEGFKAFLKVRDFTAKEYTTLVGRYPKYWNSIRPNTIRVKSIRSEIEKIYQDYAEAFPGQEKPGICFAIGCLRTGGTVAEGYLLIGTELAAADATTDKSELGPWLQSVMTEEFDIRNMIAHEYVHALQETDMKAVWGYLNYRVLMASVMEGAADFLAERITGGTINGKVYEYGHAHEAEVWAKFEKDMWTNKSSNWLYQGDQTEPGVPADLGYFVGYKICEAYYNKAEDKEAALREILFISSYKKFYKQSGYKGKS